MFVGFDSRFASVLRENTTLENLSIANFALKSEKVNLLLDEIYDGNNDNISGNTTLKFLDIRAAEFDNNLIQRIEKLQSRITIKYSKPKQLTT